MFAESLESRTLLSASIISVPTLLVTGSDAVDVILVAVNNTGTGCTVTVNGVSKEFSFTRFSAIRIDGLDGDDLITINESKHALPAGMSVTVNAGGGDDRVGGSSRRDIIRGGIGHDTLLGRAGNDRINGEAGDDSLFGGKGRDSILGGFGADDCFGGDGNDQIRGGAGDDSLEGNAGDDSLVGDAGDDSVLGGDGSDDADGEHGGGID